MDCSRGSLFDSDGQPDTGLELTLQDAMQLGVRADSKLTLQLHNVGDTLPEIHVSNIYPKKGESTPRSGMPHLDIVAHPWGMVRKRQETSMDISRFCLEVDGFQQRTKKTQEEVAKAIGVSLPYLRNVLYRSKPLTIHLVEKAAPILGLTVHDFIISGSPLPGAPPRDEGFANIMGFLGPNIPEDVKKHLIALAQTYQPKGVVLVNPGALAEEIASKPHPSKVDVASASNQVASGKGRKTPKAEAPKLPKTKIIYRGPAPGKTRVFDQSAGSGSLLVDVIRHLHESPATWLISLTDETFKVEEIYQAPSGREERRQVQPDREETRQLLEIWEKEKSKIMQDQDDQAQQERLVSVHAKKGKGEKG